MDILKRFIDVHIPINHCNFRCHYCYVSTENYRDIEEPMMKYSLDVAIKSLTKKRLGGACHFNLCGHGETLIPSYVVEFTRGLLENGHYVFIVTNGTLTNRFKEFERFPKEYLSRLGFKLSFHYLELMKLNMMDRFIENVKLIRNMGCSISIEITPNDELIKYIPEIIKMSMDNFGALPHLTVPRDMSTADIKLLTKLPFDEFRQKWSIFESELFDFKISEWEKKRKEFCYAGLWSGLLNLESGKLTSCYSCRNSIDIFKNPKSKIKFTPVGNNCKMPHCYNGHSFLTLGVIPSINSYKYADVRNRIMTNGEEWLTKEMKEFIGQKLYDNNKQYGRLSKIVSNLHFRFNDFYQRCKNRIRRK